MLTASVLMVGVPWAMAFVEEQQIMEMERTERAREVAGEVSVFSFLLLPSLSFLRGGGGGGVFFFFFFCLGGGGGGGGLFIFSFLFGEGIIYIYCGLFSSFGKFL